VLTRKRGVSVVHDPLTNKGTGFTPPERDMLGNRGLVPPRTLPLSEQADKLLASVRALPDPLDRSRFLNDLCDRNETLFYRILVDHVREFAPIVYTPTVGQVRGAGAGRGARGCGNSRVLRRPPTPLAPRPRRARPLASQVCQRFGSYFRRARGMYFSAEDRGLMGAMVHNWPADDVEVVVVTDGSRILGLGDLGAHGMGIPIGKLMLYAAAGGIDPRKMMPAMLDAGTDNAALRADPWYLGLAQPRLRGDDYFSLVHEFVNAVHHRWPKAVIQFEDFSSDKAGKILDTYRNDHLCFNDDIQGALRARALSAAAAPPACSPRLNQHASPRPALAPTLAQAPAPWRWRRCSPPFARRARTRGCTTSGLSLSARGRRGRAWRSRCTTPCCRRGTSPPRRSSAFGWWTSTGCWAPAAAPPA
jgi:malate dehydrogenase (oxaloacetate-decarboxylating)(NADP+)